MVHRWPLLVLLTHAVACVGIDPDWDPPVAGSGSDDKGEGGKGTSGPSNEGDDDDDDDDDDGEASDPLVCSARPPASGKCPDVCDQCINGECLIYCTDENCEWGQVHCPEAWPCRVLCTDKHSCRSASIVCAGERACQVDCLHARACVETVVLCADGPCTVHCSNAAESCEALELACGSKDSRVYCSAAYQSELPDASRKTESDCACTSECMD